MVIDTSNCVHAIDVLGRIVISFCLMQGSFWTQASCQQLCNPHGGIFGYTAVKLLCKAVKQQLWSGSVGLVPSPASAPSRSAWQWGG